MNEEIRKKVDKMRDKYCVVKVNVGAGREILEGYLSVDFSKDEMDVGEPVEPDVVGDVLSMPFEDESIDEVRMKQLMIELSLDDQREALKEVMRVLKSEGVIRIIDVEGLVEKPAKEVGLKVVVKVEDRCADWDDLKEHMWYEYILKK